jgi:large subunit ribosomal protein L31
MAKSITSTFYHNATATCSNCGSVYHIGADKEKFSLEICGNCHPFYTGNETIIDTSGRIDRFKARMEVKPTEKKEKKAKSRKQLLTLADFNANDEVESVIAE